MNQPTYAPAPAAAGQMNLDDLYALIAQQSQAIAELQKANFRLERMVDNLSLGPWEGPVYNTLYVNDKHNCLWYMVNGEEIIKPTFKSVRGYLYNVKTAEVVRKGKDVGKLQVTLRCNQMTYWTFEVGVDTTFAATVLAAIAAQPIDKLKKPMIISAKQGDREQGTRIAKVTFYGDSQHYYVSKEQRPSFEDAFQAATEKVNILYPFRQEQQQQNPQYN